MSRFARQVALSATICLSVLNSVPAADQDSAAHPLPTPRQWIVLAALDEATELDMVDLPLTDVLEYLKQKHNVEIQLDNRALADAGVGNDTPVTMQIKGVRVRSALRLVLRNLDLTYSVGDGYLLITSQTEAENKLVSKVYAVQDLVTLDSPFRAPLDPAQKANSDFQGLIDLVTQTVTPAAWDQVGGPGTIKAFPASRALAISQTEDAQEEIASLLAALRRSRDKQLQAAKPVAVEEKPAGENEPLQMKVYRLVRQAGQPKTGNGAAEQANVVPADQAPRPGNDPASEKGPADASRDEHLEAWAKAIADVVPEMIEPASWAPARGTMIRAVGETIVVRQTGEIHNRIGKVINDILPGSAVASAHSDHPAVRLSPLSVQTNWPQDAEPLPRDVEDQISERLDEACEFTFIDQPLVDVITSLGKQHHLQIHFDNKAVSDAGVGSDTPITRSCKGLTLRTALKLILDELDLTYVIRDEILLITSKTEAENMFTTKVYPVFDLIVRPPDAPSTRPGLDFQTLIENLTSNIGVTSWDEVGGPGSIVPFTNSGSLVVMQTLEVHEEIARFLQALREIGAAQK